MQTHSVVLTPAIEQAFHEADDYWQRALELEFGDAAGQARYELRGQGAPGSDLRQRAEAREAARRELVGAAFGGAE